MEAEELFIDKILENYQTKLPNYIKLLLNYAGYDNIISISKLDDASITELERLAKEDLTKLLNENELIELFGKIYYRNPSLFKIADGHKKLLLHLKEICTKEVENISNKFCSRCNKTNNPKEKNQKKRNFHDMQREAEHVENLAKKYVKKSIDEYCEEHVEDYIKQIDNLKVTIDNQNYCAKIKCCFCEFISTGYSAKSSKIGRKWILSNFNKHILTHLKNIKNKKYKKKDNPNNTLLSFIKIQTPNDNSVSLLPSSFQRENEIQNNFLNISSEISSDTNSLVNTIQNAEIYISPNINPTQLEECFTNSSTNLQPICEIQNKTYSGETSNLLESDFCERRIVEEADTSALLNNKPQLQSRKKVKVDTMTRQQRKLKKLEVFEKSQTKITDYFLESMTAIIEDHPDIQNTLLSNVENTSEFSNISSFLNCLRDTAMKNIKCQKHRNRFSEPLKLFSLYIFIVGGRMLYELLHANLQNILPSITTINRSLDKESNIIDGIVRLKELKLFLIKRNYPLNIFISEDQTAIIRNVTYDSKSNKMIGFVSCIENGFPKNNFYVNS